MEPGPIETISSTASSSPLGRLLIVSLLLNLFLTVAVIIGAWSITHGPAPYQLQSAAESSSAEIRDRMNIETQQQAAINQSFIMQLQGVTRRLEQHDLELGQLMQRTKSKPR
jgi:hypothetical protein